MLQWERVMADDFRQYLNISTYTSRSADTIPSTILPLSATVTTIATSTNGTTTPSINSVKTASSSIATSTVDTYIQKYLPIQGQFIDRIIKNKDVREFVNEENQILFLYSFINNDKLIIARDEATLSEIISRLEKQAFSR